MFGFAKIRIQIIDFKEGALSLPVPAPHLSASHEVICGAAVAQQTDVRRVNCPVPPRSVRAGSDYAPARKTHLISDANLEFWGWSVWVAANLITKPRKI